MEPGVGAPLVARELPALLARVHAALASRRDIIDDLNVFPVPDGDTGTNMTLTVRAGLEALEATRPAPGAELSRAVVRGALRGARGNSGVILSQVVRAVVEVVTGHSEVDARLYAQALARARDLAYEAVADPVEGTILTVVAAAADAARRAVAGGCDLVATSAQVCAATAAAVELTRDQLEVLRAAGVVDAGARGFEVLVAAVHGHLTGEDPPVRLDDAPAPYELEPGGCQPTLAHPFEVQYLLDADDEDAAPLRSRLEQLGDSVVVVAAGGLLNIHVHTDEIGPAIEAGLDFGRPSDIEVVHFGDQMAARAVDRAAGRPPASIGAVAVLSGGGATGIARDLGAVVVEGTAGELPSVADLLDAAGRVDAARVVILPGHLNAVATARTAVDVSVAEGGRELDVVEAAATPPAVLAALAMLDAQADAQGVLADMRAAAKAVRSGEVVAAVRDADTPVGKVERGQWLALADGQLVNVSEDPVLVLEHVCTALGAADAEVVTLMLGADATEAERTRARELIDRLAAGDVEVVDAGQRPARFWVGVE